MRGLLMISQLIKRIIQQCDIELGVLEGQDATSNKFKLQNIETITKILMSIKKENAVESDKLDDLSDATNEELIKLLQTLKG